MTCAHASTLSTLEKRKPRIDVTCRILISAPVLDFIHFRRLVGKPEDFYPKACMPQRKVHHEIAPRAHRFDFGIGADPSGTRSFWALPFCTALTLSRNNYQRRRRELCKLADRARQMLLMVHRWLPTARSWWWPTIALPCSNCVRWCAGRYAWSRACDWMRLCMILLPRQRHAIGRPLLKGLRQLKLQQVLEDPETRWRLMTPAY